MEEIDAFIREQCRILQCTFCNDEQIDFDPPQNIELLIRCIWKIEESSKEEIPSYKYPRHIAERLHLATKIAEYLEKFSIRGDIGFHNILYGSYNSLRYILLDTIRKIPIKLESDPSEHTNAVVNIASEKFKKEPKWVPEFCRNLNMSFEKRLWFPSKDYPELFHFGLKSDSNAEHDPRRWIANFCDEDQNKIRKSKPSLPPKPIFARFPTTSSTETANEKIEKSEEDILILKFIEANKRYNEGHEELLKMIDENAELENKINKYDPRLIEALSNPSHYAPLILKKIEKLHEKTEREIDENLKLQKEGLLKIEEAKNELRVNGNELASEENYDRIIAELASIKEKHESEKIIAEKLKNKISKATDFCFEGLEKRCKDMENIIRRQQKEVEKMNSEKNALRKRVEREIEVFDRSFGVVTEFLKRNCENGGRKSALETFMKIHISCLEVLDDIEKTAQNTIDIHLLREEIERENLNNYDNQKEMIERDISEIEKENEELLKSILEVDPNFKL